MTHAEKLQQLFEAALKDPSDLRKSPTRSFPTTHDVLPLAVNQQARPPEPAPAPVVEAPPGPVVNAVLSDTASTDPGARPDGRQRQETGTLRNGMLLALGVLFALTGIGFCWFVQSPQRVEAWQEAIRDVRSVGDVTSIGAKYQAALANAEDPSH